jgi:hypothetical protein
MQVNKIDRFILGTNPLVGIDHFLNERARERRFLLDQARIVRVVEAAVKSGAMGINIGVDEAGYSILESLGEIDFKEEIGLYVMIPDVSKYVSIQLSKGTFGLVKEVLGSLELVDTAKMLFKGTISVLTLNPYRALEVYLDVELGKLLKSKPKSTKLRGVFVHEAVTDIAVALGARELMEEYVRVMETKYDAFPGFVTRNLPKFVEFISDTKIKLSEIIVLTPFNAIGFQMTPTKDACEQVLVSHPDANIIAMSVLAGGQLGLSDAIRYLKSFPSIRSVSIGVSNEEHALETFARLKKELF